MGYPRNHGDVHQPVSASTYFDDFIEILKEVEANGYVPIPAAVESPKPDTAGRASRSIRF